MPRASCQAGPGAAGHVARVEQLEAAVRAAVRQIEAGRILDGVNTLRGAVLCGPIDDRILRFYPSEGGQ